MMKKQRERFQRERRKNQKERERVEERNVLFEFGGENGGIRNYSCFVSFFFFFFLLLKKADVGIATLAES
jgi:hypothetical protein